MAGRKWGDCGGGERGKEGGPGRYRITQPTVAPSPKHVRCSCGPVCFPQIVDTAPPLLTEGGASLVSIFFLFLLLFNESFGILSVPVPDVWLAGEHENSEAFGGKPLSFTKVKAGDP